MGRILRNSPRFFLPLHRFPACLAGWHWREGRSVSPSAPHPPSCTPFAPSPLRDFVATMGALTPAGPSPTMGQVSLIHVSDLPILRLQPPPRPSTSISHATLHLAECPACAGLGFTIFQQARRL